jgi:serine/threonine-protein kinase
MDPFVGKTVDQKFKVEERLARGGMANVYRVVHQKTNAVLALKVLSRILVEDLTAVRRFYKEARLAATLRHPNTVRVFDVGNTDDGACYMAMEFLEGHSLGQDYRSGLSMPVSRVIHVVAQILRSLGEAHETGLVHRDLKPDNVFLINHYGVPDFVKVLDFGIAKAIRDESEQLTQTGTVVGTPRYMSPEQAQGKPLDQRSDLYSLGVILYELLAGKPPFNDDIPVRLLMMHINDPPVSLNVIRPDVIPDLCTLVMELLEKEPEKRPLNSSEVLERITSLHIPPWIGHPDAEVIAKEKRDARELKKRQKESTDSQPSLQSHLDTKKIDAQTPHHTTVSQAAVRPQIFDTTDPNQTDKIRQVSATNRSGESDLPVANDLVVVVKATQKAGASRSIIWACLFSLCLGVGSFVFWQSRDQKQSSSPPPQNETNTSVSEGTIVVPTPAVIDDVNPSKDTPNSLEDTQSIAVDPGTEAPSDLIPPREITAVGNSRDEGIATDSYSGKSSVLGVDAVPTKPEPKPKRPSPNRRPRGPQVWSID